MATAENAVLEYEAGQTAFPMAPLTDSGDRKTFASLAELWSGRSGYEPVVRPDGVLTGGLVTPASGNDAVAVAALSANLAGVVETVAAVASLAITRPLTDVAQVFSVTLDSAAAVVVVEGVEGSGSAFSETRGAAGGPPLIPVGSVEIAQVRINTSAAAPISAAQILQVPGVHQELAGYPGHVIDPDSGSVSFYDALPLIHVGPAAKKVYASYAEPIFAEIDLASDFVPAEESYSSSSTQVYNGKTVGSASKSLGQAGFTAYLTDGVSDPLVGLRGERLWFKFTPNKYQAGRAIMTQGVLGISRTFPAGNNISAACTVSPSAPSFEVTG
ncbi:hypothetical protein [Thauera aromatica]|uniref:hypothetical protein n=1 Tax=Thauera aromatica TaxID=59405 RepID=UPI001FFD0F1E|nr:hypothetical protein [Thauera aromatica]MCK2095628.1 hypothetical protein [Thauera aromatica]